MKVAIVAPSPVPFTIGGAEKLWWGLWQHLNAEGRHQVELLKLPSPERDLREVMASYRRFSELDLGHFDTVMTTKYPAWMVAHEDHRLYLQHPLRGLYDTWPWPALAHHSPFDPAAWPDPAGVKPALAAASPARDALQSLLAAAPARSQLGELFGAFDELAADAAMEALLAFPGPLARALVHHLDRIATAPGAISRYAAISRTVTRRANYFPRGVPVQVVHHPSDLPLFPPAPNLAAGEQKQAAFFTASRLDAPKRLGLLLDAYLASGCRTPLHIAGTGPQMEALKAQAGEDRRVRFLGFVPDAELVGHYQRSLAVPFVPHDEDYGLITVEAMALGKPVITCRDSGGPTEFVRHGDTGWCVAPQKEALCAAFEDAEADPEASRAMGERARRSVAHVTWTHTAKRLMAPVPPALPAAGKAHSAFPVVAGLGEGERWLVLNTFAVYPPRGGGQSRIYHLYRHLAREAGVTITLLVLDTQASEPKRHWIAPGLEEHRIPLTSHQFDDLHQCSERLGAPLDDLYAIRAWAENPAFVAALDEHAASATLAICAHPYLVHALQAHFSGPWWYESHNVEVDLKRAILAPALQGASDENRRLAEGYLADAEAAEALACRQSDRLLACAEDDLAVFRQRYGVPADKGTVVPNCADLEAVPYVDGALRRQWQHRLGMARPLALFIGSWHGPNLEAAQVIAERLAPAYPGVDFLLVGSLCLHPELGELPANMRRAGLVDDAQLKVLLASADVALNPMLSGSGSNLKMLDYAACGIPILTTPFGNRGLAFPSSSVWVSEVGSLAACLGQILAAPQADRQRRTLEARQYVEQHFDWRDAARRCLVAAECEGSGPLAMRSHCD